eukprot:Nitzschia sp. Nitz4//scaffold217_size45653//35596//37428//NITZ4_007228-RA/size45653-augustus-gene-0.10-mRNA-1//-1//CDS//3329542249//8014//frame0
MSSAKVLGESSENGADSPSSACHTTATSPSRSSSLRNNTPTIAAPTTKHKFSMRVAVSVAIYWIFVSIIPIYNKYFFHPSYYPYPIATAGVQLGMVALLLAFLNVSYHMIFVSVKAKSKCRTCHRATNGVNTTTMDRKSTTVQGSSGSEDSCRVLMSSHDDDEDAIAASHHRGVELSWIFGPGIVYKLQWTVPIGFLFGLKYGVTNLGLAMLPAPTHLLLQSTDLIWTCAAAWFIKDERLSPIGYACMVACVVGSAITSLSAVKSSPSDGDHSGGSGGSSRLLATRDLPSGINPVWAIAVNLLSPILLGLCIAALRVSCKKLLAPNNPHLGGTTMGSGELTFWKLTVSSLVAFALACVMEGPKTVVDNNSLVYVEDDFSSLKNGHHEQLFNETHHVSFLIEDDWYSAFWKMSSSTQFGVLAGSLLILVFQVNCTYLTYLTSAYALGIVGQLKIIPQWIVAAFMFPSFLNSDSSSSQPFQLHVANIVGAIITMVAAAVFAVSNHYSRQFPRHEIAVSRNCRWRNCRATTNETEQLLPGNAKVLPHYDAWK